MSKKFFFVFVYAIFSLWISPLQAKSLSKTPSPFAFLAKASAEEKKVFVQKWNQWVFEQDATAAEKEALVALVTPTKELSGPAVLEKVDSEILAWFYGYEDRSPKLTRNTSKISRSTDFSYCLNFALCVIVTKSGQSMTVYRDGVPVSGLTGVPISSARRGKFTPTGTFTIGELAGKYRKSGRYNGATLGWAMQVHGNYFLHATSPKYYKRLGRRASAGCIRMTFPKARRLNKMMRKIGRRNIRVIIR